MISTVYLGHTMSIAKDFPSSTLCFLEMSPISIKGSHGLQRPHSQQSSLLSGLQRPALLLSCLGGHRVCSPCGVLISSLHCHLPFTPAGLHSEEKLLLAQDPGCKFCDKLELSICATAEVLQLQGASMPSAWGTDRRSWIPVCCHRAVTFDVIPAAVCGTNQKA